MAHEEKVAFWNWHPPLPIAGAPIFVFPLQPRKAARWFFSVGFLGSFLLPYVVTSLIAWFFVHPDLARCANLEPGWILEIFARNLGLMVLVAGGLHVYLHTLRRQGTTHRFETRELATNDPRFFGRSQVIDNVFWSCASGVTLWTAFEALFMWAYANGHLASLAWSDNPVWFGLLFVVVPFWQSVHFYAIHSLLHWRPLYRTVHALHHRNIAIGPWSGISMHPVEHVLYFSSILLHLVVPSHPLHVVFPCSSWCWAPCNPIAGTRTSWCAGAVSSRWATSSTSFTIATSPATTAPTTYSSTAGSAVSTTARPRRPGV